MSEGSMESRRRLSGEVRTFHGRGGRAAELRELLSKHGPQFLVQLGVVKQRSQVSDGEHR